MKVFITAILAIASVSARGSGPYLPSGWRPQGPAFYLPSEVTKPEEGLVQEPLFQETEASGSESLKEYGPPKLEIVTLSVNQALPDVATEQTFFVVQNERKEAAVEDAVITKVDKNQVAVITEDVATSTHPQTAQVIVPSDEQTTTGNQDLVVLEPVEDTSEVVQLEQEPIASTPACDQEIEDSSLSIEAGNIIDIQQVEEVTATVQNKVVNEREEEGDIIPTAAAIEEATVPIVVVVEDDIIPTAAVEEITVPLAEQELIQEAAPTPLLVVIEEEVTGTVSNIAEAIVNLEKDVQTVEVQVTENNADTNLIRESSGSIDQVPEGLAEYSPPGFAEYGPPKQEDFARIVQVASPGAFENNEVRRRRFSPKFRSVRQH